MRFTIVNLVYLFYTIVKGFNRSKLLSVTSTIVNNQIFFVYFDTIHALTTKSDIFPTKGSQTSCKDSIVA